MGIRMIGEADCTNNGSLIVSQIELQVLHAVHVSEETRQPVSIRLYEPRALTPNGTLPRCAAHGNGYLEFCYG